MTDVPSHVNESLNRAHTRIDAHDARIRSLELSDAANIEWRSGTTEKLTSIQSGIQWITRLILGGILAAIVAFLVAGGFNGAQ